LLTASNETPEPAPETAAQRRAKKRIGFLISSGSSHAMAIANACHEGRLADCEVAIVICNIPGAEGAESARAAGLQTVTMEGRGREQRDHEDAIDALLRKMRIDIVCLAGYLRVLSGAFVRRWQGRVLTVHPSLLPAFPRMNAQAQALEFGARITGCTVHLVDEAVDGGVILEQRVVEIADNDTVATLSARLLEEEHEAYIVALERLLSGDWNAVGKRYVHTKPDDAPVR